MRRRRSKAQIAYTCTCCKQRIPKGAYYYRYELQHRGKAYKYSVDEWCNIYFKYTMHERGLTIDEFIEEVENGLPCPIKGTEVLVRASGGKDLSFRKAKVGKVFYIDDTMRAVVTMLDDYSKHTVGLYSNDVHL